MWIQASNSLGRLAQWKTVRFVKSLSEGTAVRSPPRILLFRRNLFSRIFAQMFDGISNYRMSSFNHATSTKKAVGTTTTVWRGNITLEIGPMTSLLRNVGQWRHNTLLPNSTLHYKPNTSNLRRHHYEVNHTGESLEMAEERCLRPSERWNMRPTG